MAANPLSTSRRSSRSRVEPAGGAPAATQPTPRPAAGASKNAVARKSAQDATARAPAAIAATPAAGAQLIPIAEIDIPAERSRDLDPEWAEALSAMIAEAGLINAITVMEQSGRYRLITGLHRISACGLLGWKLIPARISNAASDDDAKLEEIVENVGRAELGALDRAHHLHDLMGVYERLHPELRRGGDRKSEAAKDQTAIFAVRSEIAERVGLSERAIRLAVAIWRDLSVASRQRCTGTWLARHQASLQALAALSATMQAKVLDILLADNPRAGTVADALLLARDGRPLTPAERRFASINKSLASLKDAELEAVLSANAERIVETLQRMGRI